MTHSIFATGEIPSNGTDTEEIQFRIEKTIEQIVKSSPKKTVRLITGIHTRFERMCAMAVFRLQELYDRLEFDLCMTDEEYRLYCEDYEDDPETDPDDRYIGITMARDIIGITEERRHECYLGILAACRTLLFCASAESSAVGLDLIAEKACRARIRIVDLCIG